MPKEKPDYYGEGDLFAVPLRTEGYAIGVIARISPYRRGHSLLGYFFGQIFQTPPTSDELGRLSKDEVILIKICGDLGLHDGSWPVLGKMEGWNRDDWPMPDFVRVDPLGVRALKVRYDPDNPDQYIEETPCDPAEAEFFPRDGLSGSGAIELILTDKLNPHKG